MPFAMYKKNKMLLSWLEKQHHIRWAQWGSNSSPGLGRRKPGEGEGRGCSPSSSSSSDEQQSRKRPTQANI